VFGVYPDIVISDVAKNFAQSGVGEADDRSAQLFAFFHSFAQYIQKITTFFD
jgi:hypothetical protein